METPHFVWICPSCARRVPRHIEECRCGMQRPEGVLDSTPPDTAEPAPTRSGRRGMLLVGVVLIVGVAAAVVVMRSRQGQTTFTESSAATAESATSPDAGASAPPSDSTSTFLPPVVGALVPSRVSSDGDAPAAAAPVPTPAASLEDVVSDILPAVASIQAGQARGTGFFIRPEYVLTNAHVVEGQTSVQLQTVNAKYSARVAGVSSGSDLAVLQVYNANPAQPTLRLGSVSTARVGQEVIAVGSALGVLSNTVTRGIVSAVRQVGSVTLIQTDAAINPGNSGGPLVDRTGLVIGVNSMGISKNAGEGVAFAVAIDHAAQLLSGQGSLTAPTPLAGLNQMMGGPSEGDQLRQRGEQGYAKVLEWAARNGDQLDGYWTRYASTCVMSASRVGTRAWFAVFEPNGVRVSGTSAYDCGGWLDTVRRNADQIRAEVDKAAEGARQNGVYPGVMRDLRRRYRMDWQGWDR